MTQQLIKPDRLIASSFLGAIITFLRNALGESVYNGFRISEPVKNISLDSSSVQFHSLMENQDITPLWDCLQGKGLELTNVTPHDSKQNIKKFKISLNLPQEFLLEYGDDKVKNFCKDFVSKDDDQNQHDGLTGGPNQQDQQQALVDNTQVSSVPLEDSREIKNQTLDTDQDFNKDNDDETIKTVEELIEVVSLLKSKQKVRTISQFFKWYLQQNEITEYEVLPRTAYKYQGNEPEFVVRILNTDDISKVFDLFKSQGCDVDLVGENKNSVRVKSLVFDSTQKGKNKHKENVKLDSKKVVSVSQKTNLGTNSKLVKPIIIEQEFIFLKDRFLKELTEIIERFLSQVERHTEQDVTIFQEMIELKKQELDILKKIEDDFEELDKFRQVFAKKYSS